MKGYCRLCAEAKISEPVFYFENDDTFVKNLLVKLIFMNAVYVDISDHVNHPKIVCIECYDKLSKAYAFLLKVCKAQDVLRALFENENVKVEQRDDFVQPEDVKKPDLEPQDSVNPECDQPDDFVKLYCNQSDRVKTNHIEPDLIQEDVDQTDLDQPVLDQTDVDQIDLDQTDVDQIDVDQSDLTQPDLDQSNNLGEPTNLILSSCGQVTETLQDAVKEKSKEHLDVEEETGEQQTPHLDIKDCNDIEETDSDTALIGSSLDKKLRIVPETPIDHNIECWKEYRWTCGICYVEQPDIETLRRHCFLDHKKCTEYACYVCEKLILDFNLFILHAQGHHYSLRDRCHYCDAKVDVAELSTHINQHLQSVQLCPNCGESFPDSGSLQQHLDSVKPRGKRLGKFVNRKIVSRAKPKLTEEQRTCPTCKNVYKTRDTLRTHIQTKHSKERKRDFVCERCGKGFYNKITLTHHYASQHSAERPYQCDLCKRKFKTKPFLAIHMKTHSTRSFVCDICGRTLRSRAGLEAHLVIHTDTFPYKCEFCKKGFNFPQCLQRHLRQHTGAKPYSCEECNRDFTDWSNFNKHMMRRHNKDMSKNKKSMLIRI